jgi:hypothetical protein
MLLLSKTHLAKSISSFGLYSQQTVLIGATFFLDTTINPTISSDCGESYHGSNSSPLFTMASIVVMSFHADGSRRSVPRAYGRKSGVLER